MLERRSARVLPRLTPFERLNLLTLLLRFSNVFFAVCVPLIGSGDRTLLEALPVVGFTSVLMICAVFISPRFAQFTPKWIGGANLLCGVLLILLFGGEISGLSNWTYRLFAGLLGVCMVGNETLNLLLVLQAGGNRPIHQNLSLFNALRVLGMALGFMLAGFIAGAGEFVILARVLIWVAGAGLVGLSLMGLTMKGETNSYHEAPASLQGDEKRQPKQAVAGLLLVILDLMVFTFWYSYIPYRLIQMPYISKETVRVFLAVQAFAHAGGQILWRNFVARLGMISSYWVSLLAHVLMIVLITHTAAYTVAGFVGLFVLMGLVNSGTYMTSTSWYYAGRYPEGAYSRIGLHMLASHVGKWAGASLAVWLII